MGGEPFSGLILSHTWWAYAVAGVLWLLLVAAYFFWEGSYDIRANLLRPWRWRLTVGQWVRVGVAAVVFALIGGGVAWGLLSWRQTYRHSTYNIALNDWTRYAAAGKAPAHSGLKKIADEAGENRAKGFLAMGKAICAGFPQFAAADGIVAGEVEAMAPALEFWLGPATADLVVQGHHEDGNREWGANCLPVQGVPRPALAAAGNDDAKWSSEKLAFLKHTIAMSAQIRGQGDVPGSSIGHPVEIPIERMEALSKEIEAWRAETAKAAGDEAGGELSDRMRFWQTCAEIALRYKNKAETTSDANARWREVVDWVSKNAARSDAEGGWMFGELLIQIRELADKDRTRFSPWTREVQPLTPMTAPGGRNSITESLAFVERYNPPGGAWKEGEPISPYRLAAVFAAEHLFVGYSLQDVTRDLHRANDEQKKAVQVLKDFNRKEQALWDLLFEYHGRYVENIH